MINFVFKLELKLEYPFIVYCEDPEPKFLGSGADIYEDPEPNFISYK